MTDSAPDLPSVDAALAAPERLDALDASGLADGVPEEAFDRLTRLVQRCLRVPVALVSLVDERRQVFKSQQGLPEPWCSLGGTALTHSFCKHVVVTDAPLVVEDAREHPAVRDNLAIRDLGVVAYLGTPLRAPSGQTLGSLCAIDSVPRAWTDSDREILDALAELVMAEIATRFQVRTETDALWSTVSRTGALFRALFEEVPQPAAVLQPGGLVVDANARMLGLAGATHAETVGRSATSMLSLVEGAHDRVRDAIIRAASGDASRLEGVVAGDGELLDLRCRSVEGTGGLVLLTVETP